MLWTFTQTQAVGKLRSELKRRNADAVRDIAADLEVVAARTESFLKVVDEAALPAVGDLDWGGYASLDPATRRIAYDLDEPTIDRRSGAALPFARLMLGARTMHEWGHLAADAGWVPQGAAGAECNARLAAELDAALREAPQVLHLLTADDLDALCHPAPDSAEAGLPVVPGLPDPLTPGGGLVRLMFSRISDFQANLVAAALIPADEMETYVRYNVRWRGGEYLPEALWRLLIRNLYEFQYLRFACLDDPERYFRNATGIEAELVESRVVSTERLSALLAATTAVCDSFAIDRARVRC